LYPKGGLVGGNLLTAASYQRAASRASNVRYEDGVACNAPGYESALIESSLLQGIIACWELNELSGSRYDISGNNHTLLETLDVRGNGVLVDSGKFDKSALFSGLPYQIADGMTSSVVLDDTDSFLSTRLEWAHDGFNLNVSMAQSFQNPQIQWVYDSMITQVAFDSGSYSATAVAGGSITDKFTFSVGIDSGTYTQTVVYGSLALTDKYTFLVGIDSGTYALTVVTDTEVGTDSLVLTASISGTPGDSLYTQTVLGSVTAGDSLTLTAGLDSGSYG
jgi:hypothetical protein